MLGNFIKGFWCVSYDKDVKFFFNGWKCWECYVNFGYYIGNN